MADGSLITQAVIRKAGQETKWWRGIKPQKITEAAIAKYSNLFYLAQSLDRVAEIVQEIIGAGFDYKILIAALPKQVREHLEKLESPALEDKYQQQELPVF